MTSNAPDDHVDPFGDGFDVDKDFREVLKRAVDADDADFAAGLVCGADKIRVADDPDVAMERVRHDLEYIPDEYRASGHIQGAMHYHRLTTADSGDDE